jgi:hypothetical protein
MTNSDKARRFARALGLKLAAKAGLDPETTAEDWEATSDGRDFVTVKITTVLKMPIAEYNRLSEEAYSEAGDEDAR